MMERIIRSALLGLVGLVPFVAAAESTTQVHGDWTVVCQDAANGQKQCSATQLLSRQLDNGQRTRLLQTTVRKLNETSYLLQFVLPLGVDLRPGIALQVDDKQQRGGQYFACTNNGCIVRMGMDQAFMSELQSGKVARVLYRAANADQPAAVNVSLKGITAAAKSL